MAGKQGESRVVDDELNPGAESLVEEELTLEQELEREARENDNETPDDAEESVEADESKQTHSRMTEEDKREVAALLAKDQEIRALRERIADLQSEEEGSDETEDDFKYSFGDLPEQYEELRPYLERFGTFHIKKSQELLKAYQKLDQTLAVKVDEINADRVREKFQLSESDEEAVVQYARDRGMRYDNVRQLEKVVESWREYKELQEYRSKKKRKVDSEANPATPARSRRATDKTVVREAGRRSYDDSFDYAIAKTLTDLKRGRFREET